jgi:hypothetical protein
MSYVDQGLEAITECPMPRTGELNDFTVPLAIGGIALVVGLIVWAGKVEEKRREERQRNMTPMERSMDDCLQTLGQAIRWSV